MKYAIPITEETREFIGIFLNYSVKPEVESRGSFFVLTTDDRDMVIDRDIVPADDEMFRVNNWNFKFANIPVWVFKQ